MTFPVLVLDANILIRAVLGNNVRQYLINFNEKVDFFIPDTCIEEANKYLPILFEKRKLSPNLALEVFSNVKKLLQIIDEPIYKEHAAEAKQRMKDRDIRDWPVMATALSFNCAIWSEDKDFFGVGIPVWTTNKIHHFFNLHT